MNGILKLRLLGIFVVSVVLKDKNVMPHLNVFRGWLEFKERENEIKERIIWFHDTQVEVKEKNEKVRGKMANEKNAEEF